MYINDSISLIKQPLPNLSANPNSNDTILNLFDYFDDPYTTGKIATFVLYDTNIGTNGTTNVVLFDQANQGAPLTVQNFLTYVNSGEYVNSFIHRSVSNFVVQGGGYTFENGQFGQVPINQPVVNEFSLNRSNIKGTIAMAKVGTDPNSATNQWFFNLGDNSSNLNNQNGGFTVFGQTLATQDLATIEAIGKIPIFNFSSFTPIFDSIPLKIDPANPVLQGKPEEFVLYQNITVNQSADLTFNIASNSRPDLVNVTINNNQLQLDYLPTTSGGTVEIVINATTLLGESQVSSLNLSITPSDNGGNNGDSLLNTPIYRFQNQDKIGTYLFSGEGESENIRQNFPNFVEEGKAFNVAVTAGDDLISFYRFQNSNVPGTYLYAGESERQSILQNFPNFIEEGKAFYVYAAGSNQGTSFYRFQNSNAPGTYLFVGEGERQSILQNFPNFIEEGIAFEVG